jgi:hypothetical protein
VPTLYHIFAADGSLIGQGSSIEEVVEIVKLAAAGRYRIELIQVGDGSAAPSSRTWGEMIRTTRGRVKLDVPPWVD